MTTARQVEAELITYCARVARGASVAVQDRREANVLAVAARVLSRRFPAEIAQLDAVSERYLRAHEDERASTATIVRNGWIVSLPRLRDLLTRELETMRASNGWRDASTGYVGAPGTVSRNIKDAAALARKVQAERDGKS